ncbi:hypothetical protein ACFCW4_02615 [Streptomyces virginiae]|uniref:hypothetical protein n=1 Tax=Streptomyces virginiae TaxID=1961 RepID=UPI0035E208BE
MSAPADSPPPTVRVTLRPGEYVLSRITLAHMIAAARAAGPWPPPLPDRCCGCVGEQCCHHGEAPCSTS